MPELLRLAVEEGEPVACNGRWCDQVLALRSIAGVRPVAPNVIVSRSGDAIVICPACAAVNRTAPRPEEEELPCALS
jgi:hypothetical protein